MSHLSFMLGLMVEIAGSNSAVIDKSWMHILHIFWYVHNPAQNLYRFYSAELHVNNYAIFYTNRSP